MPANKTVNHYASALDTLYGTIPKAVLAAIAVSFATDGGENLLDAKRLICKEWVILHENRIVPQRPHRWARELAGDTTEP